MWAFVRSTNRFSIKRTRLIMPARAVDKLDQRFGRSNRSIPPSRQHQYG